MIASPPSPHHQMPPSPSPSPSLSPSPNPTPAPPPPKRKRRRPPPPLSVTTVFAPPRLPTAARDVWKWPVTSWFLGNVSDDDVNLASDHPFLNPHRFVHQHTVAPRGPHYRLRWLEDDARALVTDDPSSSIPPIPEPLPVLPYAQVKETNACARPVLASPNPRDARNNQTKHPVDASDRPRKRQRLSCPPLPAIATPNACIDALPPQHLSTPIIPTTDVKRSPSVSSSALPTSTDLERPHGQAQPMSNSNDSFIAHMRPAHGSAVSLLADKCSMLTHVPAVLSSSVSTPVDAQPEKSVPGQLVDMLLDLACSGGKEPSAEKAKVDDQPSSMACDKVKNESAGHYQKPGYQQVYLEFQSPAEKRLMGTLTYSIPIPADPGHEDEKLNETADQRQADDDDEVEFVDQAQVEDLELEFRKPDIDFATGLDDRDTTDELGPDMLRLSIMMQATAQTTRPHRNMVLSKLQAEFERQDEIADMACEEKRILVRLKEIADAKSAPKPTPAAKRRAPERRRSSTRARSESRQPESRPPSSRRRRTSRPTRKVIELDDDEDDDVVVVVPMNVEDGDVRDSVQPPPVTDDGFLEIPKPSLILRKSLDLSSATRMIPSRDTGDASEAVRSPVGIFPRESDESDQLVRMPSPVSPLLAATPGCSQQFVPQAKNLLKPDVTMKDASGLVLKLRPNQLHQPSETCS